MRSTSRLTYIRTCIQLRKGQACTFACKRGGLGGCLALCTNCRYGCSQFLVCHPTLALCKVVTTTWRRLTKCIHAACCIRIVPGNHNAGPLKKHGLKTKLGYFTNMAVNGKCLSQRLHLPTRRTARLLLGLGSGRSCRSAPHRSLQRRRRTCVEPRPHFPAGASCRRRFTVLPFGAPAARACEGQGQKNQRGIAQRRIPLQNVQM